MYKSKKISIPKRPFSAPFWCINGHIHTIGSSLFRRPSYVACKRVTYSTPDDDFLDADWLKTKRPEAVILLLHGLEGSSERYYIRELMYGLNRENFAVLALNFRGCSGRLNKKPRFYHSGETSDLDFILKLLQKEYPGLAVGVVGFSLGGNVLLKYLGEQGGRALADAAVAISVPYDLKNGALAIGRGVNKIYEYYFLQSLTKKLAGKREIYPDIPEFTGRTLYDFDDQVTSTLHGFNGAEDYYHQCSSWRFLTGIKKETLLIHAKDDPLCNFDTFPIKSINKNSYIWPLLTEEGGHVGFWSQPAGWLKNTIADYFNQIFR